MSVNFSEITGFSKLYSDYIENYQKTADFFAADFTDFDSHPGVFSKILAKNRPYAGELKEIITNQYKRLTPSLKTFHNLNLLDKKNTLFVITGQQMGLFGGPLYTIYKIITSLKLAISLAEKFPSYNFIPLFWLEADDHDLKEVNYVKLFTEDGGVKRIGFPEEPEAPEKRFSVGDVLFDDTLYTVMDEFDSSLRNSDFKNRILEQLRSSYLPGSSYKESFKSLLFRLFDEHGLILFDPTESIVKKLLRPVFLHEVENYRLHLEKLIRVSAQLEINYHAQVKVRPVNLFMKYENERFALEPDEENDFRLRRKKYSLSTEELTKLIETEPGRFSPNVILRPLCQDYLFPTAYYIGGPGEIGYFAQISTLYEEFALQMPIIYPRASATLIEKSISNILAKYNFTPEDIFRFNENLVETGLQLITESNLSEQFDSVTSEIEKLLVVLKTEISKVDKTIGDASDNTKRKIQSYLSELKSKAVDAEKRKHETSVRQLTKLLNAVFPENSLQEREINYFYFANKYGPDTLKYIYNELSIESKTHQIITLE